MSSQRLAPLGLSRAGQGKRLKRRPFPWTPSLLLILRKEPQLTHLPSGSSFDEKMLKHGCGLVQCRLLGLLQRTIS
jgi:hypothetical protein